METTLEEEVDVLVYLPGGKPLQKETGSMEKKKSGRPWTIRTEENEEMVEVMICSQHEPHTHQTPRQIEQSEDISRSTVLRIIDESL